MSNVCIALMEDGHSSQRCSSVHLSALQCLTRGFNEAFWRSEWEAFSIPELPRKLLFTENLVGEKSMRFSESLIASGALVTQGNIYTPRLRSRRHP